jgi:uncharacterized protein (TIGR03083 family)
MRADPDLIDAHARALRTSAAIVARAGVADLGRPTPCAGWDLSDLLAHMVGQNYGFASAVEGDGDLAVFADRVVGAFSDDRAPFRPTVATASADLLDRIVANLGRDPQWQPWASQHRPE